MNTMLFVPGLESSKSEVDFGSVNRAGGWEKKRVADGKAKADDGVEGR